MHRTYHKHEPVLHQHHTRRQLVHPQRHIPERELARERRPHPPRERRRIQQRLPHVHQPPVLMPLRLPVPAPVPVPVPVPVPIPVPVPVPGPVPVLIDGLEREPELGRALRDGPVAGGRRYVA